MRRFLWSILWLEYSFFKLTTTCKCQYKWRSDWVLWKPSAESFMSLQLRPQTARYDQPRLKTKNSMFRHGMQNSTKWATFQLIILTAPATRHFSSQWKVFSSKIQIILKLFRLRIHRSGPRKNSQHIRIPKSPFLGHNSKLCETCWKRVSMFPRHRLCHTYNCKLREF